MMRRLILASVACGVLVGGQLCQASNQGVPVNPQEPCDIGRAISGSYGGSSECTLSQWARENSGTIAAGTLTALAITVGSVFMNPRKAKALAGATLGGLDADGGQNNGGGNGGGAQPPVGGGSGADVGGVAVAAAAAGAQIFFSHHKGDTAEGGATEGSATAAGAAGQAHAEVSNTEVELADEGSSASQQKERVAVPHLNLKLLEAGAEGEAGVSGVATSSAKTDQEDGRSSDDDQPPAEQTVAAQGLGASDEEMRENLGAVEALIRRTLGIEELGDHSQYEDGRSSDDDQPPAAQTLAAQGLGSEEKSSPDGGARDEAEEKQGEVRQPLGHWRGCPPAPVPLVIPPAPAPARAEEKASDVGENGAAAQSAGAGTPATQSDHRQEERSGSEDGQLSDSDRSAVNSAAGAAGAAGEDGESKS